MHPPFVEGELDGSQRALGEGASQQSMLELSLFLWKLSLQTWEQVSYPLRLQPEDLGSIDGQAVRLSITHDGDYVAASCLATRIS